MHINPVVERWIEMSAMLTTSSRTVPSVANPGHLRPLTVAASNSAAAAPHVNGRRTGARTAGSQSIWGERSQACRPERARSGVRVRRVAPSGSSQRDRSRPEPQRAQTSAAAPELSRALGPSRSELAESFVLKTSVVAWTLAVATAIGLLGAAADQLRAEYLTGSTSTVQVVPPVGTEFVE